MSSLLTRSSALKTPVLWYFLRFSFLFCHEDGNKNCLRNTSKFVQDYTKPRSRRQSNKDYHLLGCYVLWFL
jgi:hypothetical protein